MVKGIKRERHKSATSQIIQEDCHYAKTYFTAAHTFYFASYYLEYESKIFLSNGTFFYPMLAYCVHATLAS